MPLPARLTALAIFTLAALTLRGRFDLTLAELGLPVGAVLWYLAGYLTIMTNLLITLVMGYIAMGRRVGPAVVAAPALCIAMVGIVYHLVLADLREMRGFELLVDHGLHTALPIATMLWWLAFGPRGLRPAHLPWLLAWPLIYTGYALVRGRITGFWPYPFLNVETLGPWAVLANVLGILVLLCVLAAAMMAIDRRLSR